MKKIIKIVLFTFVVMFVFNGCDLFKTTVSPEKRLTEFTASLNSDSRTTTYQHVHSGASLYNQIKASTWWDATAFSPSYDSFVFSISFSSESGGIKTYTGSMSSSAATYTAVVTFREEASGDDVWYIYSISLDGTPIIY